VGNNRSPSKEPPMDTDDVKHWQAKKIYAARRPTVGCLFRLRERMGCRPAIRTAKAFFRWCVRDRRTADNPRRTFRLSIQTWSSIVHGGL
jgi:hypothetical protein